MPTNVLLTPEFVKVALLSLACCLTLSCQADQEAPGATFTHRYKEHQERIKDSDSPLGHWEINLRYPVFESDSNADKAADINDKIARKMEQFQCSEKGDHTFTAEVTSLEADLLVVAYEAMWLCSSMPAPNSTEGELIFRLP